MKLRRRAKIVCTLGPASRETGKIDELVRAGMNVVRLNFSHGEHAEHGRAIAAVREVSFKHQTPIAIIADLQGPKIRTGPMEDDHPVELRAGQSFALTTEKVEGDETRASTNYRRLPQEVKKGDRILLSDGLIELRVRSVGGREVRCEVVNGGELGSHKGINLPGVKLGVQAITPKDRADLAFAIERGVNYVAISFVRSAADVLAAKAAIKRLGSDAPVISKLEKPEAIENLDEILRVSDGVMVARGDLGVEMSPEQVPVIQKRIIIQARELALPVITATQMLESMTHNPRPTRAEASDVANAVFDGTGAVMLSAETASGLYPVEAVKMMDRIISAAEGSLGPPPTRLKQGHCSIPEAICDGIFHAAQELDLRLIAVFTETGSTARLVAKYRPRAPVVAFSPYQETRRRMALYWGVTPRRLGKVRNIDELSLVAEKRLVEEGFVKRGDIVGFVAGTPFGQVGSTNFMKLHRIGAPA